MDGYPDFRFTHDGLNLQDPPILQRVYLFCGSLEGVDRDTQRDPAGRVVKNGYASRKMIGDT